MVISLDNRLLKQFYDPLSFGCYFVGTSGKPSMASKEDDIKHLTTQLEQASMKVLGKDSTNAPNIINLSRAMLVFCDRCYLHTFN